MVDANMTSMLLREAIFYYWNWVSYRI